MNYLLDVNVLVAWGWSDHVDHERTAAWIAAARRRKGTTLMTSAIPALGFVRVSVQRTGGRVTVADASETLAGMVAALGARHVLLPDDQAVRQFPDWCSSASRTTDAHLLAWPPHTTRSWPRSTPGSPAPISFPPGLPRADDPFVLPPPSITYLPVSRAHRAV